MIHFDPTYFIFVGPAMLLALWAQFRVKSAYAMASQLPATNGLSGAETAAAILQRSGISGVGIETVPGELSDHYDPRAKMLRLSEAVYHGRTLAAQGIAAHEVGHAIQDAQKYAPLVIRNGIVPLASVGGGMSMFVLTFGFLLGSMGLVLLGVALYSLIVLFQLVNLPVEFDASNRARSILLQSGMVSHDEEREVGKVLNAAALTYVAATLSAVLTLVYYLFRAGLLGGRREE